MEPPDPPHQDPEAEPTWSEADWETGLVAASLPPSPPATGWARGKRARRLAVAMLLAVPLGAVLAVVLWSLLGR